MKQLVRRVALVSPYDFAQSGGVTEHVRQLAAQFERRQLDTTIIAPTSDEATAPANLVSLGSITPIRINGSVARTTLSPLVIERVGQLLAREQFDVIHIHEPLAPLLPMSVLNASSSANIGTFHASGERSLGYASTRPLAQWLAQRLQVRIAVSSAAAAFVERYVPGEYTIIPNGVDTTTFRPDVAPWPEWRDGRLNVLFVGRYDEPRKGLQVLLDAWQHVEVARPDARLLVIGRGDAGQLADWIAARQLQSVAVIGPVPAADLPRWYRTADVFCAPSTGQESFGIILAEAMSSGVPVIASDIEGYRSVVQHRWEGLLVPPLQPPALASSLLQLLADPAARAAFAAAGHATAQRYAWADVSEQVLTTYERARWEHQLMLTAPPLRQLAQRARPQPALLTSGAGLTGGATGAPLLADAEPSRPDPRGETPMLTESFEAQVRAFTQRVVGRVLGRSGLSPNTLTALGLVLTVIVTFVLAHGWLRVGGVLVLITSAFDMLDGALARATGQKSTFGAFLNSTFDRFAEALLFLGLLLHYQTAPGMQWIISLIYLTIVGSLMVSYTRAKAEALGYECKVGMLGRPERIMLLAFGLLVGWLPFAVMVLALFTNLTAAQRVFHVWQQDRKQHPRPTVPKAARRSWFVPRDQKPS